MAEEVVVKEQLAPEMFAAGYELTHRLRHDNDFGLLCSLWRYTTESNAWKLVLGTPLVEGLGPIHTYQRIQEIMERDWPVEWELRMYTISLLRSNHPLVLGLRSLGHFEFQNLPPGSRPARMVRGPKRISSVRVQDVFVEDAYIYFIK